jgi:small subunit ribosomal protein S9
MDLTNLESNQKGTQKIKLDFKDATYATGRRKRSIARVWIKKGSGKIFVNGKEMIQYFKRPAHQIIVTRPLEEVNVMSQYDVKCNVRGGGLSGQAGAIIHGMSRALVNMDNSLKKTLKKNKFTTRDSRKVERKKYGHRKARRSFQFSKR